MAPLALAALLSVLSCGPKYVPTAPPPKIDPITYGVTYSIDDVKSYDPDLLLSFKAGVQQSLERNGWELLSLDIDPYTDVYDIEHQGFPIEGSSILTLPDVQVHLYYSKYTDQLLLSLEFLYQEWITQTRVDLPPEASLSMVSETAIVALLTHVAQAQKDAKIPIGLSLMLSFSAPDGLEHHTAERYRFLSWQGLAERLWDTGLEPYADKPYGNPNLSVLNTVNPEPISVLSTLQGLGLDCRIVGKSRTSHRFYCQIERTDRACIEQSVSWLLAARAAQGSEVCVGEVCQQLSCDSRFCCLELNLDADPSRSRLCQNIQSERWFLGTDDCR